MLRSRIVPVPPSGISPTKQKPPAPESVSADSTADGGSVTSTDTEQDDAPQQHEDSSPLADGIGYQFHNTRLAAIFLFLPVMIAITLWHGFFAFVDYCLRRCCKRTRPRFFPLSFNDDDDYFGNNAVALLYLPELDALREVRCPLHCGRGERNGRCGAADQHDCVSCLLKTLNHSVLPRPGSLAEMFTDWVRCVTRLMWIDVTSKLSLRIARYWSDMSFVNDARMGRCVPLLADSFRAVRKRNYRDLKTDIRSHWSYLIWPRERSGPDFRATVLQESNDGRDPRPPNPCSKTSLQMLDWDLCFQNSPSEETGTDPRAIRRTHPKPPAPLAALRRSKCVLFHTHAGGFIACDADCSLTVLYYDLAHKLDCFVYSCNYRRPPEADLATESIDDVVAEYHYLLGLGVNPKRIVVVGDSAGAALTVQLLVRLREEGRR